MSVGSQPFNGTVENEVFRNILERKLVIPNNLENHTTDLIDSLLQLDPTKRLGAGPPGSAFDYKTLKAHPFFKGINFNTLQKTSPPLSVDLQILADKVQKEHEAKKAKMHHMSAALLKGGIDSPKEKKQAEFYSDEDEEVKKMMGGETKAAP